MLPAKASAKVDFRLVPNQTPQEVLEKLRAHLDKQGFTDVQIKFMGGKGLDVQTRVSPLCSWRFGWRKKLRQIRANHSHGRRVRPEFDLH